MALEFVIFDIGFVLNLLLWKKYGYYEEFIWRYIIFAKLFEKFRNILLGKLVGNVEGKYEVFIGYYEIFT